MRSVVSKEDNVTILYVTYNTDDVNASLMFGRILFIETNDRLDKLYNSNKNVLIRIIFKFDNKLAF